MGVEGGKNLKKLFTFGNGSTLWPYNSQKAPPGEVKTGSLSIMRVVEGRILRVPQIAGPGAHALQKPLLWNEPEPVTKMNVPPMVREGILQL